MSKLKSDIYFALFDVDFEVKCIDGKYIVASNDSTQATYDIDGGEIIIDADLIFTNPEEAFSVYFYDDYEDEPFLLSYNSAYLDPVKKAIEEIKTEIHKYILLLEEADKVSFSEIKEDVHNFLRQRSDI